MKATIRIGSITLIALLHAGCALPSGKPTDPKLLSDGQICERIDRFYSHGASIFDAYSVQDYIESMYDELQSRKSFSNADINALKRRQPRIGMSHNALKCFWAYAGPDRKNTYTRASGSEIQYVYENSRANYYVYVEDEVVTYISSHER